MNEEMEKLIRENAVLRERYLVMSKGFLCKYCDFKCEHRVKESDNEKMHKLW